MIVKAAETTKEGSKRESTNRIISQSDVIKKNNDCSRLSTVALQLPAVNLQYIKYK